MGSFFTRMFDMLSGKQERRILMLGLDAAGKTTVLYKLQLGEVVTTIPTIGFNVEKVDYRNVSFTVWDLGGQKQIRKLWRHYLENTDALIFVVDSADQGRVEDVKEELTWLLNHELMANIKLLVLANKQDLPGSLTADALSTRLELRKLAKERPWYVQPTCATTGQGLTDGMDWLVNALGGK